MALHAFANPEVIDEEHSSNITRPDAAKQRGELLVGDEREALGCETALDDLEGDCWIARSYGLVAMQ